MRKSLGSLVTEFQWRVSGELRQTVVSSLEQLRSVKPLCPAPIRYVYISKKKYYLE